MHDQHHDERPPPNWMLARVRKLVVAVIGTTVLLIGVAMIVLPGPAGWESSPPSSCGPGGCFSA
jgi:Putative transmembrane protein (PGPGW)